MKISRLLLICLFLGATVTLLFAYLSLPEKRTEKIQLYIPVKYGRPPAGLILAGDRTKGLEANVLTDGRVDDLLKQTFFYPVSLSDAAEGLMRVPVRKEKISLPPGADLVSIVPDHVTFRVEREITKQVPILAVVKGKPVAGHILAETRLLPPNVFVRGPQSILSSLEKIHTKPIDIEGSDERLVKQIALDLPRDVEVIYPSGILKAEIIIQEMIVTSRIEDVPVRAKNADSAFSITPDKVSVRLKGPARIMHRIRQKKELEAYIDLSGLGPGVYPRSSVIVLPPEVVLLDAEPELFMVKIKK